MVLDIIKFIFKLMNQNQYDQIWRNGTDNILRVFGQFLKA